MNACQLLHVVNTSVRERLIGTDAQICVRLESGSRVVLTATVSHDDKSSEISSSFVFDGDMVLLRGFGNAAAALEARINQARHEGLSVA
jgi:hypothetical protein